MNIRRSIPALLAALVGCSRTPSPEAACVANMQHLWGAARSHQLEHKLSDEQPISPGDLTDYLRGTIPQCPLGTNQYAPFSYRGGPRCPNSDAHTKALGGTQNLTVWRSADAPVGERAEAASRLVPTGTEQVEAERVLGEPTRRERRHGPVIYPPGYQGPTNATYSDIWCDVYDFHGGDYVCLSFDIEASRSKWENRPLLRISTGNTNREKVTVIPPQQK